MERFLNESSQIRKVAYTVDPVNCTLRIVKVGRWFVIVATGATIAVIADVAVSEPFGFRAVTRTRSR